MKKLVYNENTKGLDLLEQEMVEKKIEEENKSKLEKIRNFFERNKIFFEVFSLFFLGVMGVVISVVGVVINQRTAEIYQSQLEILDNDREPYFTMECEPIIESFESEDNYYIKNLYTIKNEGGLINRAFLYGVRGYLTIFMVEPETKTEKIYKLYISEMFENSNGLTSSYNAENRTFCFYGYEGSKYDKFRNELGIYLRELFKEYSVSVYFENYVDIIYVNYKNEKCSHTYKFLGEELVLSTDSTEKERIFIGGIENVGDTENVAKDIYKIIKQREEE